jgi:parvulin-like peptidyl-prolyl isomerase
MLFFVLISVFSFTPKEKPVAIVADKKVFDKDIPENKNLDQYLQNIVFFELAKEKGYDDSVKTQLDQKFNREMVGRTMRKFSSTASEPTFYERVLFFKNSKKKVEVQLIQTRSFTQALKAYIEVLKGENFGAVSEIYSSNSKLKKSKGFLERPLSWSFLFPPVFSLIFNMEKGGVSVPLKYGETWNIFKVIDVKEEDEENIFDRRKMMEEIADPKLKRQIFREKRSVYIFRLQKFLPWIANIKINSVGLSLLVKRLSALEENSMGERILFKKEDLTVELARGTIGEYKIQDFIKDAEQVRDLSLFANKEAAARFIRENMMDRTAVAICRRLGAHREPSLSKAYQESIRNATLDFFRRKEILPVIKENEDDLRTFYESRKDRYKVEERRKVSLIEIKEEQEAQEIRGRLLKGENFEALASKKSIERGSRKGGDIGYLREDQWGAIGREAFLLNKGEISKVFKTKRGWAIIKVTDVKESYLPDYSTVKSSVRYDYRTNKTEEIENKIFEQNKEKFGLKILN